jgi:hypothetical protein
METAKLLSLWPIYADRPEAVLRMKPSGQAPPPEREDGIDA